jgi:hypothetical protein
MQIFKLILRQNYFSAVEYLALGNEPQVISSSNRNVQTNTVTKATDSYIQANTTKLQNLYVIKPIT